MLLPRESEKTTGEGFSAAHRIMGFTGRGIGNTNAGFIHETPGRVAMKTGRNAVYLALALALGAPEVFAQAGGLPAEAAARQAADAALGARIDGEAVARMAGDQELRDSLGESGLSGRYAVVGTGNCLRSSLGFRSDPEFVPAVQTGSFVQPQTFSYTGIRTIDGSVMHGSSMVYSLTYPSTFFNSLGSFQSGGGTVVAVQQDHDFTVGADGTLTLTSQGSHGTFTKGSGLVGATVDTVGMPPLAGKISKDGRTIVLTNADMAVERITTTRTDGTATAIDRVCHRVETMYKLAD
jgi:hypothetical protein